MDVCSDFGRLLPLKQVPTHRPLSSSLLGITLIIMSLNINHKKELLRGLWVGPSEDEPMAIQL